MRHLGEKLLLPEFTEGAKAFLSGSPRTQTDHLIPVRREARWYKNTESGHVEQPRRMDENELDEHYSGYVPLSYHFYKYIWYSVRSNSPIVDFTKIRRNSIL